MPVDRHGDGAQTHHRRARVTQGRRDRRAKAVVDRADEQDGDPFALEPRRHHGVVRTGDELRIGRVFLNGAFQLVDLTPGTREIVLQVATLGIAESVRGERDSDKNPDHEREEDGRKGRDVVAKVEHALTFSPRSGRARAAGPKPAAAAIAAAGRGTAPAPRAGPVSDPVRLR